MDWVGFAKLALDDCEAAASCFRRSIEVNRNHSYGHLGLAVTLVQLGRLDEAKAALQQGLALDPHLTVSRMRSKPRRCWLPMSSRAAKDKDDWWTQIGTAFEHTDGKGWNLVLQALPLPGADGECKIVLRPPKAEREDDRQDDRRTKPNGRQDGERRQSRSR